MNSTITILFVLPSVNAIGGVSRSAKRLTSAFRKCGHRVCCIYPDQDLFPDERKTNESMWSFHPSGGMQKFSTEVQVAIQRLQPDVVLGWYISSAGFVAVSASKITKTPVVVAARGNDIDLDFFHPTRHAMTTWALQNATAVTSVSKEMAHKIKAWLDVDAVFISNSVDRSQFYFDQSATKIFLEQHRVDSRPLLGLFGEFKEKRGLGLLSRISSEIQYWQPIFVGAVRSSVAHQIPPNAIQIEYLHDEAQLRGAYGACDVIVQPSLYDGMPNVVLEALACERRVLSSCAGGLADISTSKVNAHICICDEDWIRGLQEIRRGEFSAKPISLPTPHEEAQQYCEIFQQLI
jgi:glycosyltransferase involved in cell wall biosynthesis